MIIDFKIILNALPLPHIVLYVQLLDNTIIIERNILTDYMKLAAGIHIKYSRKFFAL